MNDARHNAQNGDFEAPNFQMTNVAAKDDARNHLMRVREPYTTFCGLPVAQGMPKAEPGAEVCEDCERVFRAMRHPDPGRRRWIVDDLQSVEPESLEPRKYIELVIDPEPDNHGFARVSVSGPTREAVVEYVRSQWGDEDSGWFAEYVEARVRQEEPLAMTTPDPEVPCLVVRVDGEDHAVVPLNDGDDSFNAAAERGALDRAYEAKESCPECEVTIVVLTVAAEVPA